MKKSAVLADCEPYKIDSFLNGMRDAGIEVECLSFNAIGSRNKLYSNLMRYLKYFIAPIIFITNRKKYEYMIGWQQFYALIFAFWCNVFHLKKVNKVIVVNFTYKEKKGFVGKVYKWFMKKCVCNKYIDYLHVLSNDYADLISRTFEIDRDSIIVTRFGVDDYAESFGMLGRPDRAPKQYALAIGRSNRDYDFLIEVWKGIDENLVVISDEYKKSSLPSNILLINDVAGSEQYPWIANCNSLIIPIDKTEICSGDTVLLTAMSYAKTIFVTNPSTLAEMYVEDGVDAIYINKNIDETRSIIKKYYSESDGDRDKIGLQARQNFLDKYTRRVMGNNIAMYMK